MIGLFNGIFAMLEQAQEGRSAVPDWLVPVSTAISAVVGVIGLAALRISRRQLRLSDQQLRESREWNKRTAAYTYFPSTRELEKLEADLEQLCSFWSRGKSPLTPAEAKAMHRRDLSQEDLQDLWSAAAQFSKRGIPADERELREQFFQAGQQLKYYLNTIERYCTAVNCDVVDEATARRLFSSRFLAHFERAGSYILEAQTEQSPAYREFQSLIARWHGGKELSYQPKTARTEDPR